MTQEAAELDYGEKESLIPGRIVEEAPSDWVGGAVELHLLDTSDTNRSDETDGDSETAGDEPENNERELDFIIQKIKELHASKKQVQNADGSFRQIQWRDFAVLRRSLAGWGTRAVAAMRQAGIPAVVNERDGYFEAQEIQLLLSLLQIIDNPEQDLPMAAVLHSGLVGLDANELGALRLTGDGSLWSVMPLYTEQAQDERLLQFIAHIERWRTLSRRHGVADLLWDVYETLDYVNYVGAMPNGLVRRANVMALYERAKGFESSGFRGLFRFLRFVESLRDSNQDMAVANVVTEADDVVRLMTIHKSKGLEFPVVFLSGVQKKFNTMDFNSPLLVDKNGGIGLKGYYPDIRVSYPSMPWLYCKSIKSDAMKAEEQRILYVALTRARDKLFLTGYINKEIKKEKGVGAHIKHAALTQTQALGADLIKAGNSYLHWLLIAFARHLDGGAPLRNIIELEGETNFDLLDRQCQVKVEIHDGSLYGDLDYKADVDETTINTVRALGKVNDVALPEEIVQRFAFTYPNLVAAKTTAKISVSELKRRFAERDAEAVSATDVSMQQKPVISCDITEDTTGENAILDTSIPTISGTELADSVFGRKPLAIAVADEVVTGAQWGTLMHEAMQWLPVKKYTQTSMTDMLDSLQAEGKFSDEERSLLSDRSLYGFFNSDLGQRLIASKRVERELPFSMLFDGNRVYPDVENGERLFLQGIIDTVFVEDDQWVLVDYKTDRVKSGDELIRRYKIQMDLYKEALERLTNMPVKASYIYSFRLHEAVLL